MEKRIKEVYVLNGKEYTIEQLDQLRNEFNYLWEASSNLDKDIDIKKKQLSLVVDEIEKAKAEWLRELDKDRFEFEKTQTNFIEYTKSENKKIKDKQEETESLLNDAKIKHKESQEMLSNIDTEKKQLEKDKKEFYIEKESFLSYKTSEQEKINTEKQSVLELKEIVEAQKKLNDEQTTEIKKQSNLITKEKIIIEKDRKELLELRDFVLSKTMELDLKEKSLIERENKCELIEKSQKEQQEKINNDRSLLDDREYQISLKEAEIRIEYKKYVLKSKQDRANG